MAQKRKARKKAGKKKTLGRKALRKARGGAGEVLKVDYSSSASRPVVTGSVPNASQPDPVGEQAPDTQRLTPKWSGRA